MKGDKGPNLSLALRSNVRPLQLKNLAPSRESLLWVVDGMVSALPLEGWREIGGQTHLVLPLPAGRSLRPLAPSPLYMDLIRLFTALSVLEKETTEEAGKILNSPLCPGGIFYPEAGGVAFLAPDFARRLLSLTGNFHESPGVANPTAADLDRSLFSAGVLAYRTVTGESPFSGEDEELRERISRGIYPPLETLVPDASVELCRWIDKCLSGGNRGETYAEGVKILEFYDPEGRDPSLTMEEKNRRQSAAEKEARKRSKRFKTHRFLRRRGAILAAVIVTAGALGALGVTILSGLFAPPITREWEPREVVEGFYRGISEMNPELVDGTTTGGAGKSRGDQVLNLFAISRIRQGYEGVSPFVNAEEWLAREDQTLAQGEVLYGIADLEITELSETRFRATYQEWTSFAAELGGEGNPTTVEPRVFQGQQITEELQLIWKRKAWLISEIIKVEQRGIALP